MPDLRPFRGIAYDPPRALAAAPGHAALVAEPYDKVTERMREEYLAASPFNVVRIDLPREAEGSRDRYETAARTFRGWLAEGILVRAARPALYVYEQRFSLPGAGALRRHAFVGLVEAHEHAEGHVLPHERTFREPKADRLALLEAMRAHLDMVFLLYEDRAREAIRALAAAAANAAPIADFTVADPAVGPIAHRLTPVEDRAAIAAARRALAGRTCTIADGHHRYETAIAFRREHERRGDARPGYAYRPAAFVEAGDPGLCILPTHRLLPKEVAPERVLEAARPWFEVVDWTAWAARGGAGAGASLDPVPGVLRVVAPGGRSWYLRRRPDLDLAGELPDVPAAVRGLDVTLLHKLILERGLGLDAGAKESAPPRSAAAGPAPAGDPARSDAFSGLGYERWPEDGRAKLRAGAFGCMVELAPTRVKDVLAVARAGATMPQKSTDFYPKLLTGLIMHDVEDELHE